MSRLLRARLLAPVVALLLVGSACSSAPDPQERFAAAFAATMADSFAFSILLEADQAALADLGRQAGGAAALLSGVRLHGIVDGDDTLLVFDALGGQIIEIRQTTQGDGEPTAFLRAGVVDLLASVGVDEFAAERTLLAELAEQGATPEVLDAVQAGFDGHWIGVAGGLGQSLRDAADLAATDADAETAFGTDVRGFLDRYVEVTAFEDGVLRVGLRLGDLLRALAGWGDSLPIGPTFSPEDLETDLASLPQVVAGDVRVVDGRVEELAFDVAQAARAFGQEVTGRIVVRIQLSDHGRAGPVLPPEGITPLRSEVLDEAVAAILGVLGIG